LKILSFLWENGSHSEMRISGCDSPTRQAVPGAGNQNKPQGHQNFMYGKVNHMTSDKAQQAQDVVFGMFLASSQLATVLFNSRASHSFITSSFVAKHNLLIAT
jgi:hypothetical protein